MTRAPDCIEGPRGRPYEILSAKEEAMGEAHYNARLVWSGGALGPTKSVESYSREFQAEFEGKPPLRLSRRSHTLQSRRPARECARRVSHAQLPGGLCSRRHRCS